MIVDPVKAFKWLKNADKKNIQQSGIDVRLKELRLVEPVHFGVNEKTVSLKPCEMESFNRNYVLEPGKAYDFECLEFVEVPINCCALIIQRSSLNRLGVFITCGLYDNNFHNYIGGVIHTHNRITIEKGARIAQIVFMKSESRRKYVGKYNAQ